MPRRYAPQLLRDDPFRRIRHIPGQPVTYLQNPKVACTSIEFTLWRAYDAGGAPQNPHTPKPKFRPYIQNARKATAEGLESLLASKFFSVVRNPYARLLSAYLNKVQTSRGAWTRISRAIGLPPEPVPSLVDFLSALKHCDPYEIDHHFRPQHLNLLHGFAPLDFLGHMERMEEVNAFLYGYGFEMTKQNKNATNAITLIAHYIGPREAVFVILFYAVDFEIYGYSDDLRQLLPVRGSTATYSDRTPLRQFLERRLRKWRSVSTVTGPVGHIVAKR